MSSEWKLFFYRFRVEHEANLFTCTLCRNIVKFILTLKLPGCCLDQIRVWTKGLVVKAITLYFVSKANSMPSAPHLRSYMNLIEIWTRKSILYCIVVIEGRECFWRQRANLLVKLLTFHFSFNPSLSHDIFKMSPFINLFHLFVYLFSLTRQRHLRSVSIKIKFFKSLLNIFQPFKYLFYKCNKNLTQTWEKENSK